MEQNTLLADELGFPGDTKGKYITFFIDKQLFGMPISEVMQIIGVQKITEIPEYPSYAKGVINLRGTIIPMIDVRLRMGKSETKYTDHTCVIVINVDGLYFGLIVDGVDEVTSIKDEEISPPPKISSEINSEYLTGIAQLGATTVLLICGAKILGDALTNFAC